MYSLDFSKQAFKELEKINDPFYPNIKSAIIDLAKNPCPVGYKKLKNREGFRIKVGYYRVIYNIFDNQLIIEIITLGHRKDIYRLPSFLLATHKKATVHRITLLLTL